MANNNGRATSVPPAKTHYPPAHTERRSTETQAAADRFLTGEATIRHGVSR